MSKLELEIKKTDLKKDKGGNDSLDLGVKGTDAMILHPSFCCPVVVEEGKPITIFLLTGSDFFDLFKAEIEAQPIKFEAQHTESGGGETLVPASKFGKVEPGIIGGGFIKRHINQMLNVQHWEEDLMCVEPQKPIYDNYTDAQNNIEVTYLDELNKPSELIDKEGMIFANMRESSFKKYVQDEGFKYLFQVELWRTDLYQGLYDLSWITKNENVFDDFSDKEKETPSDAVKYYEKQDQITRKYICEDEKRKGFTHAYLVDEDVFKFETDTETPVQNHHPVYIVQAGKKKLNIGHLSDVHVSSRQFAFQTCKAKVIPGAEESPEIGSMVNITFYTLRDLMDDFGRDADIDLLIFTGDLIDYGRNYNPKSKFIDNSKASTGDIWDQMTLDNIDKKFEDGDDAGKEMYPHSIDNVLVYSLFRRYYKKHGKPILLVSGNHECYTLPYGISPRADIMAGAKSTLKSYDSTIKGAAIGGLLGGIPGAIIGGTAGYNSDKKSIDATTDAEIRQIIKEANERRREDWLKRAGNDKSDGKDKNIDRKKANEGIPADHNLTIYEAILMYGPDYNMVPMSGFTDADDCKNFKPENLDWFYNIFTPLEDFAISYNRSQQFIGLGWGAKERFISIASMGTYVTPILPRAPEAISDSQLKLINSAIDHDKGDNFLLSHFTFVNYHAPKGIESEGEVNYNNSFYKEQTDSCSGTFENNRYEVYKLIVSDKKIQYTLSGHSHRNGVYVCTNSDSSWQPGRYDFETEALPMEGTNYVDLTKKKPTSPAKMIVSSSGGPNGKQNFDNELFNWSTDYPSGTYIKYGKNDEEVIGIKRASNKRAKPRFAVALEYADIVGKKELDKGYGIFKKIELRENGSELEIEINNGLGLPTSNIFKNISTYIYINGKLAITNSYSKTSNDINSMKYSSKSTNKRDLKRFKQQLGKISTKQAHAFISFSFNELKVKNFNHYDFSKPLTIRSEIRSINEMIIKGYQETMKYVTDPGVIFYMEKQMKKDLEMHRGYFLNRDPEQGEVVNHYQLSKSGESDFVFDWDKRTDPGK